jgi:hypothetical protein
MSQVKLHNKSKNKHKRLKSTIRSKSTGKVTLRGRSKTVKKVLTNGKKKKKHKKKSYRMVGNGSRPMNRNVMPYKMRAKLPYSDIVGLDSGVGTTAVHVFTANGLYDPDITTTGHQPRGFDQYMTLYDHNLVESSRMKAIFGPADVDIIVGICLRDDTTVAMASEYIEGPNCVSTVLLSDSNKPAVLSLGCPVKRFFSRKDLEDDTNLYGSASANPTEGVYFHVFTCALDTADNASAIKALCEIHYNSEFIEPKVPAVS